MIDVPDRMPGFFEVHSTYAQKIHDLRGLDLLNIKSSLIQSTCISKRELGSYWCPKGDIQLAIP